MATLIVPSDSSPHDDAQALRKAFQGWGTDEKAIISILGHRNSAQRKQIRQAYQQIYQQDLLQRLESELSGHFERAVYRWMLEEDEREAVFANVALKSGKTAYDVIIELSCIPSPDEILAVRKAYQLRYRLCLEEDVAAHTTGDFRKLLVGLVSTYRYNGEEINSRLAKSEAGILRGLIKEKAYGDEEMIRILSTRSKAQLVATFNCYKDDYGSSITKDLLGDVTNEFTKALRTTIRCIHDPHKYFEKALRDAVRKAGTEEEVLTRVIVWRAERDLMKIKESYYKRNNVTLDDVVSKETSGDYKAFLLALLGKQV